MRAQIAAARDFRAVTVRTVCQLAVRAPTMERRSTSLALQPPQMHLEVQARGAPNSPTGGSPLSSRVAPRVPAHGIHVSREEEMRAGLQRWPGHQRHPGVVGGKRL
eukprot:scaffold271_cov252-Pinguiococcus_pyrenoidosus.AAC.3